MEYEISFPLGNIAPKRLGQQYFLGEMKSHIPFTEMKYWYIIGNIAGTHSNYYVAETEFQEGEYESDVSDNENDDDDNINDSRIDKSLDNVYKWIHTIYMYTY